MTLLEPNAPLVECQTDDANVSIVEREPFAPTERRLRRREADVRVDLAMEVLEGGFWHYDVATATFETSTHLARFLAGPDATPLGLDEYVAMILAEDRPLADLSALVMGAFDRGVAEYRMNMHDGVVRWMRCSRRLIRDSDDRPSRLIGIAVDVTEQKRLQARIEQQAKTDALTGLSNRRCFEERADAGLSRARSARTPYGFGLLLIDLDRFKPINDRYGHLAGDGVLQTVAKRLSASIRPIDLAARLGGDEFAVLVDDADDVSLSALAERLSCAIAEPMEINGHILDVGCSIGVARYKPSDTTVQDLVTRADNNLYEMKRGRHGRSTKEGVRSVDGLREERWGYSVH